MGDDLGEIRIVQPNYDILLLLVQTGISSLYEHGALYLLIQMIEMILPIATSFPPTPSTFTHPVLL